MAKVRAYEDVKTRTFSDLVNAAECGVAPIIYRFVPHVKYWTALGMLDSFSTNKK